jgi:hypothetical protein
VPQPAIQLVIDTPHCHLCPQISQVSRASIP